MDRAGTAWRPLLAEAGLMLWGAGVQLSEAVAPAGMVLALLAVLSPAGWSWHRVRQSWPLWAFVGWCLGAPLVAGHPPTAGGALRIVDWCALPVAAAALQLLGPRSRRRLAAVVAIVFLASCLAALCQHWGRWPGLGVFERWRWTNLPFQRMYEPLPGDPSRFMAGGLLLHRLKFAHVGGFLVLAYLDLGLALKNRAALAVGLVGAVCVGWLPHARAAAVALLVSMGIVLALRLRGRWRWTTLVAGAVVAVALVAGVPSLRMRFAAAATDEGSGDRRWLLASALRAVGEHPLAGVGLGRYRPSLFAAADAPPEVVRHAGKAHDQYLTLAAEAGIPAALLYIVLLTWCWRAVRPDLPLGAAGRASVAFLALVGLLHDPLFHAEVSMAAVLALGVARGAARAREGLSWSGPLLEPARRRLTRWGTLATALIAAWTLGTAASEGLMQVAADATVLAALVLLALRRVRVPPDVRWAVLAGATLAAYQALSPLLVHALGTHGGWPPTGRWLQCLDTAAAPALVVAALVGVGWTGVELAAVAGWTGSVALGLVQHLVRWEVPLPPLLRLPVDRVHEVFAPEGRPRFAAGGFFFHRLRFAHGAAALLGPALAASFQAASVRRRWVAAWLALTCALAVYLSFARAALGAVVLLVAAAGVALSGRLGRRAGIVGVAVLLAAVALAPGWRARLADAGQNLFDGERAVARAGGWDLVRDHPLLGVGFGNYYAAALARSEATGLPAHLARDAHTLWVTVWAETGLVGLLLWVAWQVLLAVALLRRARRGAWPAAGALLSLGAFQALALVHYLPFHSSVHLTFALVWGVGLAHAGDAQEMRALR